jgi:hypothetical protein
VRSSHDPTVADDGASAAWTAVLEHKYLPWPSASFGIDSGDHTTHHHLRFAALSWSQGDYWSISGRLRRWSTVTSTAGFLTVSLHIAVSLAIFGPVFATGVVVTARFGIGHEGESEQRQSQLHVCS